MANGAGGFGYLHLDFFNHGGVAWVGRGNGNATNFTYDGLQRVATMGHDYVSGDVTWTYGRNPANQLNSIARDNDTYAWAGHVNVARAYTTNGLNQYSAAGAATFTYDANGNLTADGTRTFLYDIENRMVGASGGVALSYDPLGRLYQVTGSSGTTTFLYDGDALVAEYNGATLLRRHVHNIGADVPVLAYQDATLSAPRYLFADHQGRKFHKVHVPGRRKASHPKVTKVTHIARENPLFSVRPIFTKAPRRKADRPSERAGCARAPERESRRRWRIESYFFQQSAGWTWSLGVEVSANIMRGLKATVVDVLFACEPFHTPGRARGRSCQGEEKSCSHFR